MVATALGAAPGAAFFFSAYEGMKPVLKRINAGQEHPIQHSCAASCGEVAACLVRVPTAVVTQRMQVGQYASFNEAVVKIAAENGVMTFYTGYWTTVAREIPFSFIQFPMYEGLKKFWRMAQGSDTTAAQGAACGSLAGAISSAVTTPLDVAKTRMMIGAKTAGGQLYSELGGTPLARGLPRNSARNSAQFLTPRTPVLGGWGHAQGDRGGGGRRRPLQGHRLRVGWITLGGYIFFGAYEKSMELLWKSGGWGAKPWRRSERRRPYKHVFRSTCHTHSWHTHTQFPAASGPRLAAMIPSSSSNAVQRLSE